MSIGLVSIGLHRKVRRARLAATLLFAALFAPGAGIRGEASSPPEFPYPPAVLERVMRTPPTKIGRHEWIAGRRHPVIEMEAYYPAIAGMLHVKWKAATEGLESRNNTPRREIAAYQIQKWFLDPVDYVVPTTVGLCIPLDVYAVVDDTAAANPAGGCVFGTLAIWLEDVRPPEALLDTEHFHRDPLYARHLAHYNLLTYLIDNRDTRPANALVSEDPTGRRVFSIDNGVSFGELLYNFFRSHWNVIRVPALPREAIERLRAVDEEAIASLAIVAEFRADSAGNLLERTPAAPFETERGVRIREDAVQLGLDPSEIDGVRRRLRALLESVDAGDVRTW